MRTSPLLGLLALVSFPSAAHAGGLGILATGGMHTARSYYYTQEGVQGIDSQTRPNAGFGLDGLLGDKDDRIQGLFRVYVLRDAPITAPDTSTADPIYPEPPTEPHDIGVANVGIQWGLFGDPSGLHLVLNSRIGAAFATTDNTEFALAEASPGVTYALTDQLQAFGNVAVTARFRKFISFGGNAYGGVRFMFD